MKISRLLIYSSSLGAVAFALGALSNCGRGLNVITISSVSPSYSLLGGGTRVTITGTKFFAGMSVKIGGSPCTQVSVTSTTQMTCITPAHTGGYADVSATTSDGQATSVSKQFHYNTVAYLINNGSTDIYAYMLDTLTGVLTQLPMGPFSAGTSPQNAVIDPSGKFLYVGNSGAGTITGFSIDRTSGVLTSLGSAFGPGGGLNFVTPIFDPAGKNVYINHLNGPKVWNMAFNSSTGALTGANGNSATAAFVRDPAISPDGTTLYVVETTTSKVEYFSINADGSLGVAGNISTAATNRQQLAIDPKGKFLFVARSTAVIFPLEVFNLSTDPTLQSPTATNSLGGTIIAVDPLARFVYTFFATTNQLMVSKYDSAGAITAGGTLTPALAVAAAQIVPDPSGQWVYFVDQTNNQIIAASISTSGTLTQLATYPGPGTTAQSLAILAR
ncbi:MAG: beta-propeller fold lactonase family protein [Bdellovibrionota bacterium]